jgi:hypothetical protein
MLAGKQGRHEMATAPTPAEVARLILDRFKKADSRAGHVLRGNNIVGVQTENKLLGSEITEGLQYAADQGWIEQTRDGSVQLTEAGFAVM